MKNIQARWGGVLMLAGLAAVLGSCRGWPPSLAAATGTPAPRAFTGIVRSGSDLGEVKAFCAEGLYLVAEEGYLAGQTTMLLLRAPDASGQAQMLSDASLIGRRVEVVGRYPAQDGFCEALICACEDYILVDRIDFRR
ncbi:MAG TPA: hypothetical protein VFI11_09165 [Anaerolineales bacterium]|nr:hypothetical protein [Anaerolineales bacterium]